jgi:hypothetical protein
LINALAARDVGTVFRFLASRGWSRSRIAAATGLTETRVRAVAKGEQLITSYDVLTRIADGLAIDRGLMGLALIQRPATADRYQSGTGAVPVQDRAGLGETSSNRMPLSMAPTDVAGRVGGLDADIHDDEGVFNEVRAIATDYLHGDPIAVYTRASALAEQAFVSAVLRGQPTRSRYETLGYLYAMLAWMAGDLGRRQASSAHARTAWLCASHSGNDTTLAWVLSSMSKTALWEGRTREAAELAGYGRSLASTGSAPATMLACQEADAWAAYGNADAARHAITSAAAATDAADHDHVGGLLSCGGFRYLNYVSAVLVKVGDAGGASRAAIEALSLADGPGPAPAYGTLAQTRISGALAHIHTGDLDGAAELLAPVLATPRSQRLGPVAARTRAVERAIQARPGLRSAPLAGTMIEAVGE